MEVKTIHTSEKGGGALPPTLAKFTPMDVPIILGYFSHKKIRSETTVCGSILALPEKHILMTGPECPTKVFASCPVEIRYILMRQSLVPQARNLPSYTRSC